MLDLSHLGDQPDPPARVVVVASSQPPDTILALFVALGAVVVLAVGISYAIRERRRLLSIADEQIVENAAKALKASRQAANAVQRFADRIKDRASTK